MFILPYYLLHKSNTFCHSVNILEIVYLLPYYLLHKSNTFCHSINILEIVFHLPFHLLHKSNTLCHSINIIRTLYFTLPQNQPCPPCCLVLQGHHALTCYMVSPYNTNGTQAE